MYSLVEEDVVAVPCQVFGYVHITRTHFLEEYSIAAALNIFFLKAECQGAHL